MATQNSSNQEYTNNADGFSLAGGASKRKLTVSGADVSIVGGGSDTYNFPGGGGTLATLQAVYPVGSIYMNAANATNPAAIFGFGTWVAFGAGRMPVGFNSGDTDFNAAEKTGGSKTNVLSQANLPSGITGYFIMHGQESGTMFYHGYGVFGLSESYSTGDGNQYKTVGSTSGAVSKAPYFDLGGQSTPVNNMTPYITVYMWKRTA